MEIVTAYPISQRQRHLLEHTVGFKSKQPFFRNYFCAGPDHDDWNTLQYLCDLGYMRVSQPSDIHGGMSIFSVTDSGKEIIKG